MSAVTSARALSSDEAVQGSLAEFALPALCRLLAEKRRTGALSIVGGSEIWFSEGRIYLATTADSPPLSAVLFGADIGALDEIESLFARLGDDHSIIDRVMDVRPDAEGIIRRMLHEYNLNSLFELLVPSDAIFRFEGERRHRLGDRFASDTKTLLAQAERRLDIWRKIALRIRSTDAVFRLVPALPDDSFERLVSADEWQYLARLDGSTSVADVITATGESAFRVTSTLYRLLVEGLIAEVEEPGPTSGGAKPLTT